MNTDEEKVLQVLKEAEGPLSMTEVMRLAGLEGPSYYHASGSLAHDGLINWGAGANGGSMSFAGDTRHQAFEIDFTQPEEPTVAFNEKLAEKDLYDGIETSLRDSWRITQGMFNSMLVRTAHLGKRKTGGRWTRPDFLLICAQGYPHIPGKHMEVIAWEVKPYDEIDIRAVYESLAHHRNGTSANMLLHAKESGNSKKVEENIGIIFKECIRYGIGLIIVPNPSDIKTWQPKLVAEKHATHVSELNAGIDRLIHKESSLTLLKKILENDDTRIDPSQGITEFEVEDDED